MRKSLRIASMVLAALLFFSYDSLKAQVKIGGNPASIDPNAILELESSKKGFLLPRVSDMSLMSASATEGYLVYYTGSGPSDPAGLFVKVGAAMVRVTTEGGAGSPWKIDGNASLPVGSFLGSKDASALEFRTDNLPRITIGADGKLRFGAGVVAYQDPTDLTIYNDVLVIAADGTLLKRDMGLSAVTSLNTLKGDLEIALNSSPTDIAPKITTTPAAGGFPGSVELSYPILLGQTDPVTSAEPTYGFMHIDDYKALQALKALDGLKVVAVDPSAVAEGGTFTRNATTGKWELALAAASETTPGIVTIDAQTFAGDKKFVNTTTQFDGAVLIRRDGVLPGAATLTVEGAVTLDGVVPETLVNTANYSVLIQNPDVANPTPGELRKVTVPGWKLTGTGIGQINTTSVATPAVGTATGELTFESTGIAGPDFVITSAPDKVTFNLPDAAATSRGVVSTAAQTFAGDKTFSTKVLVGAGTVTTASNLNVNGSVGVKFRLVTTGSTIAADDYIVMTAATSATSALTLPDATTCAGRIYVIKRIPGINPLTEEDNNIVITPGSGQTINGVASTSITVVHTSITLMSDGTANWQLLSRGTGF